MIFGRQLHSCGAEVFLQPRHFGSAGDWHDPRPLCARIQANAIWAGVTPFPDAILRSASTSPWFARRFSSEKRGTLLRRSFLSSLVSAVTDPARKPRPSGAIAVIAVKEYEPGAAVSPRARACCRGALQAKAQFAPRTAVESG